MKTLVRISPRAARDLDDIAEYFRERSNQAATRFQSTVEKTLEFLEEFPEVGSTYTKAEPTCKSCDGGPFADSSTT